MELDIAGTRRSPLANDAQRSKDLDGRRVRFTDSQIRNARRLIEGGEPANQVKPDPGMSRATPYRREENPAEIFTTLITTPAAGFNTKASA